MSIRRAGIILSSAIGIGIPILSGGAIGALSLTGNNPTIRSDSEPDDVSYRTTLSHEDFRRPFATWRLNATYCSFKWAMFRLPHDADEPLEFFHSSIRVASNCALA